MEVDEIAQILAVDAVLFGELQRVEDTLKITYRVARGYDGKVVSSGDIAGRVGDEFALQGELAVMVRNDLVGESPQQLISASRTPNSEAFDRYMRGLYVFERRGRGRPENLDIAIELFEQSTEIDPGFGPAYLSLATAYALLPDYRNAPLEATHQLAIATVEQGVEADESIRDAASALFGFVFHKRREWTSAETAYVRATSARVVDSNAFNWYSLMLAGVGRLDDALEQVLEAQKIDPSSAVINSRVAILYTWLGESDMAAEFYERSNQLGASGEIHLLGNALLLIRQGRVTEASELTSEAVSMTGGGTDWIGPVFAGVRDPAMRGEALAALDVASKQEQLAPRLEITARAVLGDVDGAMRVANLLVQAGEIFEMDILFIPELRELRRHGGFPDLMQNLGVKAYWDENGCVWLDDRVHCPN
jgi:tetratricopeptide (TPR) repeat protein